MQPRIIYTQQKKLIGKRITMSIVDDRTAKLWQSFMPVRNEIPNAANKFLYSVQVFCSEKYFEQFSSEAEFEKWAAVEVSDISDVPAEMETMEIPEGNYAVFNYKGPANASLPFFQYIFQEWIPKSEYTVDNRPHFALMGEKYRGNNLDSEEEIWVPVKIKSSQLQ